MRVLIVEDDNALADGLIRTLRQSGYAVDTPRRASLQLRACAEENYDLVVLDVSLPASTGRVLRQLAPRQPPGSILILTAHRCRGRSRPRTPTSEPTTTSPSPFASRTEARVGPYPAAARRKSPQLRLRPSHRRHRWHDGRAIGSDLLDLTPRVVGGARIPADAGQGRCQQGHMLQAMCSWTTR